MCATCKAAALLAAANWLTCEGHAGKRYVVSITHRDGSLSETVRDWGTSLVPPRAAPGCPKGVREFSDTERKILAALVAGDWVSSQKIADAAGLECTEAFKGICSNLVDRLALEAAPGRGYRLARPA